MNNIMSTPYKPELTREAIHKLVFLIPEVADCELGLWARNYPTIFCTTDLSLKVHRIAPHGPDAISIDELRIDIEVAEIKPNFSGYTVQQYLDGVMKVYGC